MHFLFYGKKSTAEKIKEATFKLLSEKGYAMLSMRRIAKEAGISVGQVTYYYKTKDKLVTAVIDEIVKTSINALMISLNKNKDKMQAIICYFEKLFDENVDLLKVLIDLVAQALWNKKIKERLINFSDEITNLINVEYLKNDDKEEIKNKERFLLGTIYGLAVDKFLTLDDEANGKNVKKIKYGRKLMDLWNIKNLVFKNEEKYE